MGLPGLLGLLGLLAPGLGCKEDKTSSSSSPPAQVRFEPGKQLASFGARVSAGARGPRLSASKGKGPGMFAVGTVKGGVLVDVDKQTRLRLLADIGAREREGEGPHPDHDGPIVALEFSPDGRSLISLGGHTAIWWDLPSRRMLRQVRGPFGLTSAAFGPDSKAVFFANDRGHLYRWRRDQPQAEAVKGFFCRPMLVPPERRRLDPDKRCRVGHYSLEGDKSVCLYAVTQLVRRGRQLARACREGSVGVMSLDTRKIRWSNLAGHLSALAFVGDGQLIFGRQDGDLRLWDLAGKRVARHLAPGGRASALASDGELIAAAQGARVRIWHRGQAKVIGAVKVPRPVVWLGFAEGQLSLLLDDGRLVAHGLRKR